MADELPTLTLDAAITKLTAESALDERGQEVLAAAITLRDASGREPSRRPPSPPPKSPPLLESSCLRFSALAHPLPDEDDLSIVTVAMQASGEDVLKLRIHRTHTLYDLESTLLCLFQSSWFPGPFPCPRGTSVRVVGLHDQGPLDKVLDLLEAAADDRIRIVCVPQDE